MLDLQDAVVDGVRINIRLGLTSGGSGDVQVVRRGGNACTHDLDEIQMAHGAKCQKHLKHAIDLKTAQSLNSSNCHGIYSTAQLILLPNNWQSLE